MEILSTELGTAYISILPSTKGLASAISSEINSSSVTNSAKNAGESIGSHIASGIKGAGSTIVSATGHVIAGIATASTAAVTAAGAGIIALGKQAVASYADFEQLQGGIEKLFGDEGYGGVISHAQEAFKTAGLSMNEYMETVTGFSASLITSLGGDTAAAAEIADMAIRDMSDNANTFGTDMASIQAAYQGFAKGNYTMLDNLKLGFGGSQEGMQALIDKANELKIANGELGDLTIDSFADIVSAIHIVQDEFNITGTTEKEAATTIAGSLNMTQAAWKNFVTILATESDGVELAIDDLVNSIKSLVANVTPIVQTFVQSLSLAIPEIVPPLLDMAVNIIGQIASMIPTLIPPLVDAVIQGLNLIVDALPQILPPLIDAVVQIIVAVCQMLPQMTPALTDAAIQLFMGLVEALPTILVALLSALGGVISAIFAKIIGSKGEMTASASTWFTGLMDGAAQIIPNFLSWVASIPGAIVSALGDLGGLLWNAGTSIIGGFLGGLQSAFGGVMDFVSGVAGWIYENKGPLTYDAKLLVKNGNVIMEGLENGLREGFQDVQRFVLDANNLIQNGITGNTTVTTNARSMVGETATGASVSIKDCTFNVRKDDDITAIANAIGSMVTRTNSARLAGVMA